MNELNKIVEKLLSINFSHLIYRYEFLYNELFISIIEESKFILYGINYKGEKIIIKKYTGDNPILEKKLIFILKKAERILIILFNIIKSNINKVGEESEFIYIFDKSDLDFSGVEKILNFSFIDDYTFRRKSELDFKIDNKSKLNINHSDFECSICSGPIESFTNFPDYHLFHTDDRYFKDYTIDYDYEGLYTYINDYESIVLGGNEKINEIVSNKEIRKKYDLISINKTCISVIMGDDIKSVLNYNNFDLKNILYTDQNIESGYKAVINFLKNIDLTDIKNKNNKILFFGINKNKNTYELIKYLNDNFGIEVGNILLPNINIDDFKNINNYELGVFFKGREVKIQGIFKLYPINHIETIIPYGITNFNNFCKKILYKLGKDTDTNIELINNDNKILKEKYKQLYNKSKKYGIGFIIFDFHIEKFLYDNFRGIPILSMIEDMGFKINFFIYSNSNKYINNFKLFKQKGYNIIISNKKYDLDNYILDNKIDLYYSEISGDNRIIGNNKEQFSLGDLEYGIEGFFRSFERLIKKCEKRNYYRELIN